jgi:hypothetical protein
LPKYHSEWRQIALVESGDNNLEYDCRATHGGAIMRSYFMIVAWAVFGMFVATHIASTQNQITVDTGCIMSCPKQTAEADNGIGVPPPIDPDDINDNDGN